MRRQLGVFDGARNAAATVGAATMWFSAVLGMLIAASFKVINEMVGEFFSRVRYLLIVVLTGAGEARATVRRTARLLALNAAANGVLAVAEVLVPSARREWFVTAWRDVVDEDPGWPRLRFALGAVGTALLYRINPSLETNPKKAMPSPATSGSGKVTVTVETPNGTVRVEVDRPGD